MNWSLKIRMSILHLQDYASHTPEKTAPEECYSLGWLNSERTLVLALLQSEVASWPCWNDSTLWCIYIIQAKQKNLATLHFRHAHDPKSVNDYKPREIKQRADGAHMHTRFRLKSTGPRKGSQPRAHMLVGTTAHCRSARFTRIAQKEGELAFCQLVVY